MGVRENKVEKYLDSEVMNIGGITRKWVSPGRDGVPDRLVFIKGNIHLVEVKTSDGVVSDTQKREHERMREVDILVYTVYGEKDVDIFIKKLTAGELLCGGCQAWGYEPIMINGRCKTCNRTKRQIG